MADRTVVYRLRAELGQFKAQMAQAGASTKKLAGDLTSMDKSAVRTRQGLDTLGSTAGKIGLVAAGGLGAAVLASANFDQAMSEVQAATHETTSNMELLRQAALDAGQATAFSATEAAAGIEELSKAGVSTSDILSGGLSGALDLAAAGGIEVAEAAETAASAMTQFGISGQQVPHIADLLAAGAGKAQGSVSDLGAALNQSGLVAAQTGLTIEEATGTLSAFAAAGLTGSDAGTSFKTMLQSLTPTSAKARELMDELGISAYDAQGNFVGMTEFAGSLQAGLADLSVEQQNAAMKTIFGADAVRAASVVFENGAEGVQGWIDKVDDAGYAAETAATRMDNLKGDWEEFTGSLETALIGTGDGAQGPLRSLLQNATAAVNAYNSLPPSIQTATAAALGLTAVVGGGLWFGSKVIQGVADTREALEQLGVSSAKTKGVLSGTAKAAGLVAAAMAADFVAGIGDANLSLEQLQRNLALIGQQGDADDVFTDLSFGVDSLGEALHSAVFNDLDYINRRFFGSSASIGVAKDIKELDTALSQMDPTEAAAAFETIVSEGKAAGVTLDDINELFPQYQAELKLAGDEASAAADATTDFVTAEEQAAAATKINTQNLRENIEAMREKRAAAIEAANAEIAYEAAIDDAQASIKENGKTLDITTEKGRANKTALLNLAGAWNAQSNAVKSSKGAHAAAIDQFVRVATQMGMNEDKARAYANQLLEIPPKRETQIKLETGDAATTLSRLNQDLSLATRPRTIQIAVNYAAVGMQNLGGIQRAQGGPVYGPGTSTSDSIPARLSDGEYVVRAAAVQRYGVAFLHDLNAMRFAEGGLAQRHAMPVRDSVTVGSPRVNVGGPSVRVFIDGKEVRAITRSEIAADKSFAGRLDDRD